MCLNGYGGLQDFSIWNHPSTTALPEGFASSKAAFAILHISGAAPVTKLAEGPLPALKIYDQGLQGQGYHRTGSEGFPRFEKCVFKGEYPFGQAHLSDSSVPLQVTVVGGTRLFRSMTRIRESLASSWNTRFTIRGRVPSNMNFPITFPIWLPDADATNHQVETP